MLAARPVCKCSLGLTERSMLEREHDGILDPFKGRRAKWTRETLRKNKSDPTIDITSIPMTLLQDLAVESRKAKHVLVAIAVEDRTEVWPRSEIFEQTQRSTRLTHHIRPLRPLAKEPATGIISPESHQDPRFGTHATQSPSTNTRASYIRISSGCIMPSIKRLGRGFSQLWMEKR